MLRRFLRSFSVIGMILGVAFFCASLTPSLVPRAPLVQGVLSGVSLAVGYGIGRTGLLLWRFLELPMVGGRTKVRSAVALAVPLFGLTLYTLSRMAVWQDSIRERMTMPPVDSAYPAMVVGIALATALFVILLARFLLYLGKKAARYLGMILPRRVSVLLAMASVSMLFFTVVNDLVVKSTLRAMDNAFAAINRVSDDEIARPLRAEASGSAASLIAWDDIGRNGKRFAVGGPRKVDIEALTGRAALDPLRIYGGYSTGGTLEERAEITLAELKRVGGFERSVLVVATPTGTGWLDPAAVDPVAYLHDGDMAIVSMQYSYLPSWLTLLVDPDRSRDAAKALFSAVFTHWTTLPKEARPKLYLHGLSLGALGSEASLDFMALLSDPIDGGMFSGPPFPSTIWPTVTKARRAGSPAWRPEFRDGSLIRFMTQYGMATPKDAVWGPMRIVYLQHASDPMSFFSPDLAFSRPAWLSAERAPDVSPYFRWFPVVTFLQVGFDLTMASNPPSGFGHSFKAMNYIDAWIAVTDPPNWTQHDTENLKRHFADFDASPI